MNIDDLYPGKKIKFKDNPPCNCADCQRLKGSTVTIERIDERQSKPVLIEESISNIGLDDRYLEEIQYQLPEHLFEIE